MRESKREVLQQDICVLFLFHQLSFELSNIIIQHIKEENIKLP